MFHNTFLKILRGEDELEVIYNKVQKLCAVIDYNLLEKTPEMAVKLAPIMMQNMKKDQTLIHTDENYYVARDISTNTYYMCYKNILMIDIDMDKIKETQNLNQILQHFSGKDECFKIYESRNGYHVFCISRTFHYRDPKTIEFMLNNYCDFYYSIHAYIRGFSVRLNKKFNEKKSLYTCHGLVGNIEKRNTELEKLVDLHIKYTKQFEHTLNNQ